LFVTIYHFIFPLSSFITRVYRSVFLSFPYLSVSSIWPFGPRWSLFHRLLAQLSLSLFFIRHYRECSPRNKLRFNEKETEIYEEISWSIARSSRERSSKETKDSRDICTYRQMEEETTNRN
jgi:uncharacterized membrane protein YagU involved in acid resistance